MGSWADEYVDAYMDFEGFVTEKEVITGNIDKNETWSKIDKVYDFSICTHTIEDVTNPLLVLEKIQEISNSGFISFPNKFQELKNVESSYYLGYCHHKHIFTLLENDILKFIPKYNSVDYFNHANNKKPSKYNRRC
ncbi:methionine biosynthesis protein MetW [Vibrio sp. PP-XX7]